MTHGIGNEWDAGDPPEIHRESLQEKLAQARKQIQELRLKCEELSTNLGAQRMVTLDQSNRAEKAEQQLAEARQHCSHCFCECPECSKR